MACRAFRVAADQRQELPVGADPNAFVPLGMSGNIRTVRFWQSELFGSVFYTHSSAAAAAPVTSTATLHATAFFWCQLNDCVGQPQKENQKKKKKKKKNVGRLWSWTQGHAAWWLTSVSSRAPCFQTCNLSVKDCKYAKCFQTCNLSGINVKVHRACRSATCQ